MVRIYRFVVFFQALSLILLVSHMHAASMMMHHTSFDGGLYWKCPIAGFQFASDFQMTIFASHETKYSTFEDSTSSSWRIDGLETYLVCNEKNQMAWRSPTGDTANFDRRLLATQKSVVNNGCILVIISEEKHVVIDNHSRKWFYRRGSLEKVQFSDDGELIFKSTDGMIHEIINKNIVIFSVQQQGPIMSFFIKDRKLADIQYDVPTQLIEFISFEDPRRRPLQFLYQDKNLVQINEGGRVRQNFVWKKTGLWKRRGTLLQYSSYLHSDGFYVYEHDYYLGLASITATDRSGNREEKILNLKSGLITDKKSPTR